MRKAPIADFSVLSLILGLVAFTPFANIGCAVIAVVLGVLALKKIVRSESNLRGESFAAAGIVLGAICTIISISMFIRITHFIQNNPDFVKSFTEKVARP